MRKIFFALFLLNLSLGFANFKVKINIERDKIYKISFKQSLENIDFEYYYEFYETYFEYGIKAKINDDFSFLKGKKTSFLKDEAKFLFSKLENLDYKEERVLIKLNGYPFVLNTKDYIVNESFTFNIDTTKDKREGNKLKALLQESRDELVLEALGKFYILKAAPPLNLIEEIKIEMEGIFFKGKKPRALYFNSYDVYLSYNFPLESPLLRLFLVLNFSESEALLKLNYLEHVYFFRESGFYKPLNLKLDDLKYIESENKVSFKVPQLEFANFLEEEKSLEFNGFTIENSIFKDLLSTFKFFVK